MNTKDLIERLRTENRDSMFPELCAEAAEALERLQAERDTDVQHMYDQGVIVAGQWQDKCDALQKQVKMLRDAGLAIKARLDRNGIGGRQLPEYQALADALTNSAPGATAFVMQKARELAKEALAATEPK